MPPNYWGFIMMADFEVSCALISFVGVLFERWEFLEHKLHVLGVEGWFGTNEALSSLMACHGQPW